MVLIEIAAGFPSTYILNLALHKPKFLIIMHGSNGIWYKYIIHEYIGTSLVAVSVIHIHSILFPKTTVFKMYCNEGQSKHI